MAEVNLKVTADIDGIKTKLEELTKSVAEVQSKMGTSMKAAAETSEKAMIDASNTITTTMVNNTTKVIGSLEKEEDQLKALQMLLKQSTNPESQKSLQKEIDATSARIKSLGGSMQKFRDISVMSLGEMRRYMKELRNISLVGMTPEQIGNVNAQMAKLKDRMSDYALTLKTTGDTTQMVIGAMQGFVGIAQGVTGTLSLMGIENKNLEKSMMALINLSQMMSTFHQLEESGILAKMGATIKDTAAKYFNIAANKAQAVSQNAVTASSKAAAVGFKVLGVAMKSVPILALIAAGIALVEVVKSIVAANEEEKRSQESLKRSIDGYIEAKKLQAEANRDVADQAKKNSLEHKKAMGEITQYEYDIAKAKESALDMTEKSRIAYATAEINSREIANKQAIAEQKRFNAEMDRVKNLDYGAGVNAEQAKNNKLAEVNSKHNLNVEKINNDYRNRTIDSRAKYNKDVLESEKSLGGDIERIQKEENERKLKEARQAWETYINDLKSVNRKIEDMRLEFIENDLEREQAKLNLDRKRDIEDVNSKKITAKQKAAAIEVINATYAKRSADLTDKYIKDEEEKEKELYSYKKDVIEQNKKNSDEYYNGLLKSGKLDEEQTKLILDQKRQANYDYYESLITLDEELAKADGILTTDEIANLERLKKMRDEFIEPSAPDKKNKPDTTAETETAKWEKRIDIAKDMAVKLYDVYKKSIDDQIKAYDDLINQREQRIGEIQSLLEAEIQLNKDGFASNIQLYQSQLEQEQKLRDDALAQQEKYNRRKAVMESFEQSMDISSAIASILADAGVKFGVLAPVLGGVAVAALLTLFKQMQSKSVVKFEKGGRGVFDGPSHSNGGVPFGNGLEAQGGEAYYILNKSATNGKGRALMDALFDAVNGGRVNFDAPIALADSPVSVELKEQKEIREILGHMKKQKSTTYGPNYRIVTFGNVTRKILN